MGRKPMTEQPESPVVLTISNLLAAVREAEDLERKAYLAGLPLGPMEITVHIPQRKVS